jgi:hypothetical protein
LLVRFFVGLSAKAKATAKADPYGMTTKKQQQQPLQQQIPFGDDNHTSNDKSKGDSRCWPSLLLQGA